METWDYISICFVYHFTTRIWLSFEIRIGKQVNYLTVSTQFYWNISTTQQQESYMFWYDKYVPEMYCLVFHVIAFPFQILQFSICW